MKDINDIEIRATRRDYGDHCDLLIFSRDRSAGRFSAVKNVVFEEVEPGAYVGQSLSISNTAAQTLMDSLWSAGFRRPKEPEELDH